MLSPFDDFLTCSNTFSDEFRLSGVAAAPADANETGNWLSHKLILALALSSDGNKNSQKVPEKKQISAPFGRMKGARVAWGGGVGGRKERSK